MENMTREELKEKATELGIKFGNQTRTHTLIELIDRVEREKIAMEGGFPGLSFQEVTEDKKKESKKVTIEEEIDKKKEKKKVSVKVTKREYEPLQILKSFYSSKLNRPFYAGHFVPKNETEYNEVKDKSIPVIDYNKGMREIKVEKKYSDKPKKENKSINALDEQLDIQIEGA